MKHFNKLFSVMIGLILSTTAAKAEAGVVTQVVVKNQLKQPVSLVPSSVSQILGTGSPPNKIIPGATQAFTVISPFSNIASIHFSYTTGTQGCRFGTSLTTTPTLFGGQIPKWTKNGSRTGSNVTCDAKITSVNSTNYSYTVEFTLR
ncbi:MAG: hypothetical protein HEQ12_10950 [Aphanizomenon flos-aquae DEX188]|jgi:hypothetical protein|nr:MAG: hypothetical protein HEQ12_10950 [Aphanizomenon flos-aquae DEX188]